MREQECYMFLLLTERGNESICWIRIPAGVYWICLHLQDVDKRRRALIVIGNVIV